MQWRSGNASSATGELGKEARDDESLRHRKPNAMGLGAVARGNEGVKQKIVKLMRALSS